MKSDVGQILHRLNISERNTRTCMVSVPSRITVREDERLRGVPCLQADVVKVVGGDVELLSSDILENKIK